MAKDVGIFFDSNSFKEFNKSLEKFNKISTAYDTKLKKVGTSLNQFFKVFESNTSMVAGIRIQNVANSLKELNKINNNKFAETNSNLKNLFKILSDGSKTINEAKLLSNIQFIETIGRTLLKSTVYLDQKLLSNADKLFGAISNAMASLNNINAVTIDETKIDAALNAINKIVAQFSGQDTLLRVFDLFKSFKSGDLSGGINRFFGKKGIVASFGDLGTQNISVFIKAQQAIEGFVSTLKTLSKLGEINISEIQSSLVSLNQITQLFTGQSRKERLFGFVKNLFGDPNELKGFLSSFGNGSFLDRISNVLNHKFISGGGGLENLLKPNGIIQKFEQFSKVDTTNFRKFAIAIKDFVGVVKELSVTDVTNINIGTISYLKEIIDEFTKIFTGQTRLERLFNIGKSLAGGTPLREVFETNVGSLFEPNGVIDRISKIKIENLGNFAVIAKTITKLTEAMTEISKSKIDLFSIQELKQAFNEFFEIFTGKGSFIFRQKGLLDTVAKFSGTTVTKFSDLSTGIKSLALAFGHIGSLNLDSSKLNSFGQHLRNLLETINSIAKEKNFDANSVSKLIKGLSELSKNITFGSSLQNKMEQEGKESGNSFVDGVKDALQIQSPSKVMQVLGGFALSGFVAGLVVTASIQGVLTTVAYDLAHRLAFDFGVGLVRSIPGAFSKLGNTVISTFTKIFQSGERVRKILSNVFSSSLSIAIKGFEKLKTVAIFALDKIGKGFNLLKNQIGKFNPFSVLTSSAEKAANKITNIFKGIGNQLVFSLNGIVSTLANSAFDTLVGSAIKFEDAFVGVQKTLDTSNLSAEQEVQFFKDLDIQLRSLATNSDSVLSGLSNSSTTILTIAEAAGSLGITNENLQAFTETVGAMTTATNLSADAASNFFGQFGAVTQTTEYERLGSTMVGLGNKFAATESQIADFAIRLAGAGESAGFTEANILGIAAAMASVGINAEAGGSAMTQIFDTITKATAGMQETVISTDQFIANNNASIEKLTQDRNAALRDLEAAQDRLSRATTRSSQINAEDAVAKAQSQIAALDSQIAIFNGNIQNAANTTAITLSGTITPELQEIAEISGISAKEFADSWGTDPAKALDLLISGFGKLTSHEQVAALDSLGLDGIRTAMVLRLLGNAEGQLSSALTIANEEWENNNALMIEAEKRNQTTQASVNRLKNNLFNMQVIFGRYIQPAFKGFIDLLTETVSSISQFLESEKFQSFANEVGFIFSGIGNFIVAVNKGILTLIGDFAKTSGALDKFKNVFAFVSNSVHKIILGLNQITGIINSSFGFINPSTGEVAVQNQEEINKILSDREKIQQRINDLQTKGGETYQEYVVEAGDTLYDIAQRNNVSLQDLIDANKDTIKNPSLIFAGQKIKLPVSFSESDVQTEIKMLKDELANMPIPATTPTQFFNEIKTDIGLIRNDLPLLRDALFDIVNGDYASGLNNIKEFFSGVGSVLKDTINSIFGEQATPDADFTNIGQSLKRQQKTDVASGIQKWFEDTFLNIDLSTAADYLLAALGVAITAVFGVPGALAFGFGKLVAEAIANDFLGIDTALQNAGVYEAIESVKKIINDLLSVIGLGSSNDVSGDGGLMDFTPTNRPTNPVVQSIKDFVNSLKPIVESFKTIDLTGFIEGVTNLFNGIAEAAGPAFTMAIFLIETFVVPALNNLAEGIVQFINELDPEDVQGFVAAMALLFGAFALPTVLAFTGAVALIGGVSASIGDFATAIADLFGAFGLILQGDSQGAIEKLGDAVEGIWNAVKNFTEGAVQPFVDLINKLLELNGSDFRLMSVEQAFQTLELVIKGVMTAIKLTVDDFFSRFELQILDFELRLKTMQIDLEKAKPGLIQDAEYIAGLEKQRDELLKRQSGLSFGFGINEIVSGQIFSGLDLGESITFENFNGTEITKSIEQILADPELVNELSQSTRDLLVNVAEKAFSSGDADQIADALKIYDLFDIAIPTDLDTDQQLVAKTATAFGELVSAGWGNVNLDEAAYDAIIKPISDAIANEDIMGAVWSSINLHEQTFAVGKDIGAALRSGLVEEFKTEGGSGLLDNFLPLIDFENPDFQAQFDEQIAKIADMYQDPELALQIAQALESQLENAISVGTGEQIDLTIDPDKFNLEFQQKEGIEAFFAAGSDLVNGIVQGLTGGDTDIETGITDFWTLINDTFKAQAGIESPSTVFAEHGSNMVEGLTQGIISNQSAIQAVSMLFGGINLIFQQYSENLALATMRTYEVTQAVINGFTIMTEQANLMAIALLNLSNQIQSVLMGLANISVGSSLTFQLVAAGAGQQPEGRAMGGDIMSGKVYEVLENGLPFEIFETNGRKYFLSGSDGTMYSPNAGLGTSNTNNYTMGGDTYQIQATFMSEGNNEAVINKLVTDVKEIKKGNKQIGKNARRAGL